MKHLLVTHFLTDRENHQLLDELNRISVMFIEVQSKGKIECRGGPTRLPNGLSLRLSDRIFFKLLERLKHRIRFNRLDAEHNVRISEY